MTNREIAPRVDEILWEPAPLSAPDPLPMSDEDLLATAIVEAHAYRVLAQLAIHQLHDVSGRLDWEREAHQRTRNELRRYIRARVEEAA